MFYRIKTTLEYGETNIDTFVPMAYICFLNLNRIFNCYPKGSGHENKNAFDYF